MSNGNSDWWLSALKLARLGTEQEAGLCITSLPLPRGAAKGGAGFSLRGMPTFQKTVGTWWGESEPQARRVLLVGDGGGQAPAELQVERGRTTAGHSLPRATTEVFERSTDPWVHWERERLVIEWQGRKIGLAMGMYFGDTLQWWEYARLVTLAQTETCVEVHMAGSIPTMRFTSDDLQKYKGYHFPGLHKHHWMSGHIYARLHANGVCEVYARHVNSKFADDGLPLHDVRPVVGIHAPSEVLERTALPAVWDGTVKQLAVGDARFDLADAAHLATAKHPGQMRREGEFLVWQPYMGVGLFGGASPLDLTGDPNILKPEQHIFPRGMSRTLRFSLSLNPARSPRVVRYLAPAWWYGHCEEFAPKSYLPVQDKFEWRLDQCQKFMRETMEVGGFEDGNLPRGIRSKSDPRMQGRSEPSWEGEAAGSALLLTYRTGDASDYDQALRIAYCFNDLFIDHAAKAVRMHGYAPVAFALPMNRVHGSVYAWLETGDEFCLDAAKAVIENSHWTQKNSWPRMSVGRDACYIRGAMLLYRFTNEKHFLDIAKFGVGTVVAAQMPEGWFGDQGGGSGIHGWSAYIAKPWMGLMAMGGVLDYLDLFPDGDKEVPGAVACVKRFADWLMRERYDHEGVMGWGYQHLFNGKREFTYLQNGQRAVLPGPQLWHMDYLARLMPFCTMRFGDPAYYDAFVESFEGSKKETDGDHGFAQSVQFVPWLQAMTWRARLDEGGRVVAEPVRLGKRAPERGMVMGPGGIQEVQS